MKHKHKWQFNKTWFDNPNEVAVFNCECGAQKTVVVKKVGEEQ